MRYFKVLFVFVLIFLCCSSALATTWLQDYAKKGINVVTISADLLYEYGSSYAGQTVVTAITVKDKSKDCLKADTNNNDSFFYSIIANFSNSEISNVNEGQKVIIIGKVRQFNDYSLFGSGKTVELDNCHIVRDELSFKDIEGAKEQQLNAAKENAEQHSAALAQAALNEQQSSMNNCEAVNYNEVERNPNQYKGKHIFINGSVIQVSEGWFNSVTMRVDEGANNIWYVTYKRKQDNEARILEGDVLSFYGECDGVETYTTIFGGSVTIPALKAEVITGESVSTSNGVYSQNNADVHLDNNNIEDNWTCTNCGSKMTGKFCSNCGTPRPNESGTNPSNNYDDDFINTDNSSHDKIVESSILSIIPNDSLWGLSIEKIKNSSQSFQSCLIGEKQGLKIPSVYVCSYLMDGYYVFEGENGSSSLTKVAYILKDSANLSKEYLNQCVKEIIGSIKEAIGDPSSQKKGVTTWEQENYSIQLGSGRFKNYSGNDNLSVGIVFKYTPQKIANSSNQNINLQHTNDTVTENRDYVLLKEYRWSFYDTWFYTGLVIQNTSGVTKDFDAQVQYFDKNNQLIGVGNYSVDVIGDGQKALIKCQNETAFDHVEYTITAKNSRNKEVQSFIDIKVQTPGNKAILSATNMGNTVAKFVEYNCLFINNQGQAVGSGWGYLVDSDYELKPGLTEYREETCSEPFSTVEVYITGR